MKRACVRVSDHALLRHMQRVMGLPVEDLRVDLERRINETYLDGACGIRIDGFSYRIEYDAHGAVITTVLKPSGRILHRKQAEAET